MKKVLIITYYWPPAGGPGVQRVLKFAKYLPDFGWQPIILTVSNGDYYNRDEELILEIPDNCKVYKTKTLEPYNLYKKIMGRSRDETIPVFILNKDKRENIFEMIFKWIRVNLFIPDPRIGWFPFAVKEGLRIIEEENVDIIFTSSPPHSVQLIGKKLSKRASIKWIADFRDPWIDAFWFKEIPKTRFTMNINKNLEKAVLKNATCITAASQSFCNLFKSKVQNKYFVLPNGFDYDDYNHSTMTKGNKFIITHAGNISKAQSMDNFFRAITKIKSDVLQSIEITLYGSIHPEILNKIDQLQLNKIIKINPSIPHQQFIEIIMNSNILLLLIPNTLHNKGIVPAKLFEYLATKNYILGIGPQDCDAAYILKNTNCGEMFDYEDDIDEKILQQFERWKNVKSVNANNTEIDKYSRKKLD